MKKIALYGLSFTLVAVLVFGVLPALAAKPQKAIEMGNGMPSGDHETLLFHGKNELIYWDQDKSYSGYTLWSPTDFPYHIMIDMGGNVVKLWKAEDKAWDCNPQLLENGNILYRVGEHGEPGGWKEIDWDGNDVWSWMFPERILLPTMIR